MNPPEKCPICGAEPMSGGPQSDDVIFVCLAEWRRSGKVYGAGVKRRDRPWREVSPCTKAREEIEKRDRWIASARAAIAGASSSTGRAARLLRIIASASGFVPCPIDTPRPDDEGLLATKL